MKIVEDRKYLLSDGDIPNKLFMESIGVECPRCRNPLRLPELYITQYTAKQVDRLQGDWNDCMTSVVNACRKLYGEDPRLIVLLKELAEIKKGFLRPELRVVTTGRREGDDEPS